MRYIRLLSAAAALVSGVAAADLSCESVTTAGTYNWSNTAAWNCYGQGRVAVPNEYPGKNFPANNYTVQISSSSASAITEMVVDVDSAVGLAGKNYRSFSISASADNGSGAIQATCSGCASTSGTVDNTKIQTGDKVFCSWIGGTTAQNNSGYGIWPVTVTDANTFTLVGSSYASQGGSRSATCTSPEALNRTGSYNSSTGFGRFKVNANVKFTVRGDIRDTWAILSSQVSTPQNWMVRCGDSTNGGCTWVWDGSGPVAYGIVTSGNANANGFYLHGTASRHAVVTCLNGANPCSTAANRATMSVTGWHFAGVDADYVDFSNLGQMYLWYYNATPLASFSMTHFSFTNCPFPIDFSGGGKYVGSFTMAYGTFSADSCTRTGGCIMRLGAPAGTPFVIGPAVAFLPVATPVMTSASPVNMGPIVLDRDYVAWTHTMSYVEGNTGAIGSAIKNSLFAKALDAGAAQSLGAETIQNNYFWQGKDVVNNNHGWVVPGVGSNNTIQLTQFVFEGNVLQFEEGQIDGAGNIMDEVVRNSYTNGANPAIQVYWRNNIDIPNTDFDGTLNDWTSINSMLRPGPPPGMIWHYYNNTHFTSHDSIPGFQIDHVGTEPYTGAVAEFRCNAVSTPTTNSVVTGSSNPTTLIGVEATSLAAVPIDSANPLGLHHNAAFGYLGRRANVSWLAGNPAYGTMYLIPLSQTPAGVANGTDQYYDNRMPKVVDRTRRLRTWVNQKYGQSFADDRAALAYLRADVNGNGPTRLLDIPDLVAWVRAGWTLNEPTLYKACGDGTHIGAAVAPPTVNPGVSGVIVAGERRSNAPPMGPAKAAGRVGDAIATTASTNGIPGAALTDTADVVQLRPDLFEELRTDLFRDVLPVAALRDLLRDVADVLGASRKSLAPLR